MPLYQVWQQLSDEFDKLVPEFETFAVAKSSSISAADFDLVEECTLEGLLSRSWQAWCNFCRSCVIDSCLGTTDGNGAPVPAHPSAHTEQHVSGAWLEAKKKSKNPWGPTNAILRLEPTWGDTDTLVSSLPRMDPTNKAQLLAAFSSAHPQAKILQLIRNAAAHNNPETMASVTSEASKYIAFSPKHPLHALFWLSPVSKDYLVLTAIEELRDAALTAIS
ncbi:MAG TPA: hypothetical protein VFG18_05375 [Xanthomonadaceae bacterium]|nr:hypothetical protein [Xanthomonadaceae bacterium]